ncbi:MAG: hypothetical protein OTJ97_08400, partial [SAR202 cluster bacterium]|nr:hypothetical protein [SAR202 cluster bacterium]
MRHWALVLEIGPVFAEDGVPAVQWHTYKMQPIEPQFVMKLHMDSQDDFSVDTSGRYWKTRVCNYHTANATVYSGTGCDGAHGQQCGGECVLRTEYDDLLISVPRDQFKHDTGDFDKPTDPYYNSIHTWNSQSRILLSDANGQLFNDGQSGT